MEQGNLELLETKVSEMSKRLDLGDQLRKNERPWYKNFSTYISVAALLFSFGTTYVSFKRTTEEDIQNLRSELREMLQRLADLPKENLEAYKKYEHDPSSFALVSGFIAQENNLLPKQAEYTISKLPADRVSPTDYYAVGLALSNSRYFDAAIKSYSKAVQVANGLDDEVSSLRGLANMMFVTGKIGDGREAYQDALDIFAEYKGFDSFTIAQTHILTELNWASSEASTNSPEIASRHLARADQIALSISGPNSELMKSQVSQARTQIASGASSLTGVTTPPISPTPSDLPKP